MLIPRNCALEASESPTMYESTIPASVQPGQPFEVHLPNGNKFQVYCPESLRGGSRFRIHPFQVAIPEGMRSNRIFTALVNGERVSVRAPRKKKPGDTILIHVPVFNTAASAPQKKAKKGPSWDSRKWEQYLEGVQKSTPGIQENLLEKVMQIDPDRIPSEFVCPITTELIVDPVISVDGHTYERKAIEEWFESHETSPKTNEELPSKILIPNRAIRSQIVEFIEGYVVPSDAVPADVVNAQGIAAQSLEVGEGESDGSA